MPSGSQEFSQDTLSKKAMNRRNRQSLAPERPKIENAISNGLRCSRSRRNTRATFTRLRPPQLARSFQLLESACSRMITPVFTPAAERWFDVALVVEDAPSMVVWQQTIRELTMLLERQGAFRDVRRWRLRIEIGK